MKDLYNITQKECIEIAKRNIVDCIYSTARIEGIAVTFPDTMQIYEGRSVANLSIDDVNKVNNLKHAWQFVFESIDYPLDILYLRQLNQIINAGLMTDAGLLRNYEVSIGGTLRKPEIPDQDRIVEELNSLMRTPCATERAIKILLYIMRAQMFSDGNKRVAQFAANQILIQNGKGVLRIPVEKNAEFYHLLVEYYETGQEEAMTAFFYHTSIMGKKIVKNIEQVPINEEMFKNNTK